jgi:CHAD domain-containing protein
VGFQVKKNESASAGVRRIARELVDHAVELIEKKKADPAETIHELRKQLKKFRAVLRLVRGELGGEVYKRDNVAARDLGRKLSPARDAGVRVSSLESLQKTYEKDFPAEGMASIRKRLVTRHRAAVRRVGVDSTLSFIARDLKALRRRVRTWPLAKEGYPCLEPGLRRVYRQGKKSEADAYVSGSDEAFHEYRKRAKDLRYLVDLLEPVWPEVMQDVEKTLHKLTDCLGDDHDLSDLRRILTTSPRLTRGSRDVTRVLELIDRRRSELQAEARPIGSRTYCEKPKAFSARIGFYWDAWRS